MKKWTLAWRGLARRPGFSFAAVLILALGIGANTAMFSMLDAILLKPLPYPQPGRLVTVMEASTAKSEKTSLIAPSRLEDWNRLNRTFVAIAGIYSESVTDTSGAEPERLEGRRVSPRYFAVYGMQPLVGRTFTPQEELFGGPGAVVISEDFWRRRFHADPNVVADRLIVGGKPYSIVGVMPRAFASARIDAWLPAQFGSRFLTGLRDARFLSGVGRMKPGVTIAQAQPDLARVQRELGQRYPQTDKDWSAMVGDLKEFRVGYYRRTLYLVFGAVSLLLLIAVANIAGLMLAQLYRRSRELAIRSSIGGTRVQVVGAVLREVSVIAVLGVAIGSVAAFWLVQLLELSFHNVPRSGSFTLDWRALAVAASAGVIAILACGLLPALQATRGDLNALLAQGGRGDSGGRHRWQAVLVAGQVALTVLLLASAGLMLRSYYNLSHVSLGFEDEHAITFHVGAAWDEDRKRIGAMQEELISKLEQAPGVEAAGFTNFLPTTGATLRYQVRIEGLARTDEGGRITVGERSITSGYLKAMGARMVAGSSCPDLRVLQPNAPKGVVNRRFAELYGGGQNLVGRHLLWVDGGLPNQAMEITGIAADMREDSINGSPVPYVYVCIAPGGWPDPEYVVRTHGDPRALAGAIPSIVHAVAPGRAVFGIQTLADVVDSGLEQPRLDTRTLTSFAAAALLLACVGLYSLVSLAVSSRAREIGVRMTLGAGPGQIVFQVLGRVGRLLATGAAAGLILTFLAQRVLRSVVFGVSPLDAATLVTTVLLLAAVAAMATLAPARRAARVDPLEAIRTE